MTVFHIVLSNQVTVGKGGGRRRVSFSPFLASGSPNLNSNIINFVFIGFYF
jgi:hypothetical protein